MIGVAYYKINEALARAVAEKLNAELVDLDDNQGRAYDTIVSVGGDGTFAKAVSTINFKKILGVRKESSVGAHCACSISELRGLAEKLLNNDYEIKQEPLLQCFLNNDYLDCAVNEVIISSSKFGRTLKYELIINEKEMIPTSGSALFIYTRKGYTGFIKKLLNPYGNECVDAGTQHYGIASIASNYGFNEWKELSECLNVKVRITNKWGGAYLSVDGSKCERELKTNDLITIKPGEYEVISF